MTAAQIVTAEKVGQENHNMIIQMNWERIHAIQDKMFELNKELYTDKKEL